MSERCPIQDPHFCLGARCQLTGICDFNRRLAAKQEPLGKEFEFANWRGGREEA